MVSAGRVLIMPKGAYDASETYSMLDLVSYNGSSYIAKKSTTGNLPTNTTYWQLSAYGGSASNIAGNFATLETTDYASQNYSIGDYLVTKDSQLCEVIATITTGDELVLDTNIEVTSVEAMIEGVKDYVDDLDKENVKLKGMTAISVQTDLDTMTTLGNYYKASGSFYVTNAPTGIDSEITALFRLTVENGSDSTDKYLQTLITNDGKTYKRGYDGSDWSDWIEFSTADVVATKQPKTLETTITIGGTVRTTVEAALGALEDAKADSSDLGTAAAKDSTNAVTQNSTDLVESGAVYPIKNGLTPIIETGTTASQRIDKDAYFYLNGSLARAKTTITSGATFTLNTNYVIVTAGALNELKATLNDIIGSPLNQLIKTSNLLTLNSGGGAVIYIPTNIVSQTNFPIAVCDNTNNHAYTLVGKNSNGLWTFNVMKLQNISGNYTWVPAFNTDCDVIVYYI